ncbi:MAG: hypothetical protein FJZ00_07600 [Candidatus Sericytochromatia bacterium]|uniref:Uncharacterized protein n=1 Tax=Candidatus Tanganyikabacteria bacterium TaxID=2961651 RepID=A0A938BL77_9BACT|nr:hypothetical protein [Candidatus Tanganyikabacteria bacterium]
MVAKPPALGRQLAQALAHAPVVGPPRNVIFARLSLIPTRRVTRPRTMGSSDP